MAKSVEPDQTPRSAASDLGLHCLQRPNCLNNQCYYSSFFKRNDDSFKENFDHLCRYKNCSITLVATFRKVLRTEI